MTEPAVRGHVVVAPGSADERRVPLFDRLVIGRECAGVAESRRLIIEDSAISRHHLEIRLDGSAIHAVDVSANGTLLNGVRMERGVRIPLGSGDELELGDERLRFVAAVVDAPIGGAPIGEAMRSTSRRMSTGPTAMVVGDIVDYSAIAGANDSRALTEALEAVFGELRLVLRTHGGMLANYAGDAFFGAWPRSGCDQALAFAADAARRVDELAPTLALEVPGGGPLQMGWGVALGDATISVLTGALTTVVGEAANVAFRLAGIAARGGRDPILVLENVFEKLKEPVIAGEPESIEVKGRAEPVIVRPLAVSGR